MTKKTGKKKPAKIGRTRIPIDPELLKRLAETGCSRAEIASMLRRSGVQVDAKTIERRLKEPVFAQAWEDGMNALRVKLRSRMVQQAMMMNGPGVHQSQFLAHQYLGMSTRVDMNHSGKIDSHVEVESAEDSLNRKLDDLRERLTSRATSVAAASGAAALDSVPDGVGKGKAKA